MGFLLFINNPGLLAIKNHQLVTIEVTHGAEVRTYPLKEV